MSEAEGQRVQILSPRTFNQGHTFDHDVDGVVHRAELVPGQAAVLPCIRLRHVHDAKRLLVVQE